MSVLQQMLASGGSSAPVLGWFAAGVTGLCNNVATDSFTPGTYPGGG